MIEFNEIDGKIAAVIDKNLTNCWCFLLWNVKHNQARNLND